MTVAQLQSGEHEIESHTVNYVNFPGLSENEQIEVIKSSQSHLKELERNCKNIIYPFGSETGLTKTIARQYYCIRRLFHTTGTNKA